MDYDIISLGIASLGILCHRFLEEPLVVRGHMMCYVTLTCEDIGMNFNFCVCSVFRVLTKCVGYKC